MGSEVAWERIQEALDYDVESTDLEDLKKKEEDGEVQLWELGDSAALTTGVWLASGGVGVKVIAVAGVMAEVIQLLDDIEYEARQSGVELITCVGRRGWKGLAKERGWDDVATLFVKRLK